MTMYDNNNKREYLTIIPLAQPRAEVFNIKSAGWATLPGQERWKIMDEALAYIRMQSQTLRETLSTLQYLQRQVHCLTTKNIMFLQL